VIRAGNGSLFWMGRMSHGSRHGNHDPTAGLPRQGNSQTNTINIASACTYHRIFVSI